MSTANGIDAINEVVAASRALTNVVDGKVAAIDASVAAATERLDDHIQSARGEWPIPANLVANATMRELDGTVPKGYSASGLTLEAVHPFTKGFEGPYTATEPENATSDINTASEDTPYWFGRYSKGPRWPFWCGGLADGWSSFGNKAGYHGHLLKVTGTSAESHSVFLPRAQVVYARYLRMRFWVKLVRGSAVYAGNHAGYLENKGSAQFSKETLQAATDGWYFVDERVSVSGAMAVFGNACSIGFPPDETIEAYIALPYIFAYYPTDANFVFIGD